MTPREPEATEFDPEQPFALQLEWLANRYNPGYFLGGTIRPELRLASLGWHARRVAGVLALLSGAPLLLAVLVTAVVGRIPPDPWSLGFGLLSLTAGLRMWKVARTPTPSRHVASPAEGRKLLRALALAVLGAGVVVVGCALALLGVGMAMVVSRGSAVVGVAVFVVLAGFAAIRLRRRRAGA
jgi:hypothetical protein